jgi:NAD(P)-dependent dehydrogenase (short-subunit alcohol dehydrogenase family)
MSNSFQNKVVLVTGGTSGIGKTTAIAFAAEGAKVVVSGRREAEGSAVVAEIKAAGGEATFVRADVSVESEIKALVEATVATYGRLDIAFNNAGVEHTGPVIEVTAEAFHQVFNINVLGVLLSQKYEIPAILAAGGGAIINTSSVAGHIGMANAGVYIASKHAVEGLTKTTALEYATQGIRVNAVAPGPIVTDMLERFAGGGTESEGGKYLASLVPMKRLGTSEEIAETVLFLASDKASYITGQSLAVDGGFITQ